MITDDMMKIIEDFHGGYSDIYIGILSKYHLSTRKNKDMKTSLYHVGGSISRIEEYADENYMNSNSLNKIMKSCARKGDIIGMENIYTWAKTEGLRIGGIRCNETATNAVLSGDMETIKWCEKKGFLFSEYVMDIAVKKGDMEIIRWLISIKCPFCITAIEEASAQGNIEIVQILNRNFSNSLTGSKAVAYASRNGHIDIIRYLVSDGYPVCESCSGFAALGGHLDILEYFHVRGYVIDKSVCYMAAMRGHLDVIKWARNIGILWDGWTIRMAKRRKYMDIVEYAIRNGCPLP